MKVERARRFDYTEALHWTKLRSKAWENTIGVLLHVAHWRCDGDLECADADEGWEDAARVSLGHRVLGHSIHMTF